MLNRGTFSRRRPPVTVLLVWGGQALQSAPSGLGHLASILERNGYRAEMVNLDAGDEDRLCALCEDLNVDILGFSGLTCQMTTAYTLARRVKQDRPQCLAIVGGVHPSGLPLRTLRECEALDAVVVGEGEQTVLALAEAAETHDRVDKIPGLALPDRCGGVTTRQREYIDNLDDLPFAKQEMYGRAPGNETTIDAVRGCIYRCLNCPIPQLFGRRFRLRSPGSLAEEIEMLASSDVRTVRLPHCIPFRSHKGWARELYRQLSARGLNREVMLQVDGMPPMLDDESIDLLVEMGFRRIDFWGACSGDDRILRTMRKPFTAQQLENTLRQCKGRGLEVFLSFAFGNVGESEASATASIELAKRVQADQYWFGVVRPFPCTGAWSVGPKVNEEAEGRWDEYDSQPQRPIGPLLPNELPFERVFALAEQARKETERTGA